MALSDKALSIIAFAAYHSLSSGEHVREVLLDDGNGHRADPDGLDELRAAGLIEIVSDKGRLTDEGDAVLVSAMDAMRATGA